VIVATPSYGPAVMTDLAVRTDYEAWLLEAVYEITDQRIAVEDVDELIYPPNGGPPTQTVFGAGNIRIGDWRPGFLQAGAPLILVSSFKLLDMLLEWVLVANGHKPGSSFSKKIKLLHQPVTFPPMIESRPWLKARLLSLYERLDPLRGTIIHDRHFSSSSGGLQVSSSRGGTIGPPIFFTPDDLRSLASLLVSLLRHLDGSWPLDEFRNKRLRRIMDELSAFHALPSLGQLPPGFMNVRLYTVNPDQVDVDLDRVRRDVAFKRPGQDVMFDLRVVSVGSGGSAATMYRIPWNDLRCLTGRYSRPTSELTAFAETPPPEIDLPAIAREMGGGLCQPKDPWN
jgi:hypothetical protein